MQEFRQLIHWATGGRYGDPVFPGTLAAFRRDYSEPIEKARNKDASKFEKERGEKVAAKLKGLIEPYVLIRNYDVLKGERRLPKLTLFTAFVKRSKELERCYPVILDNMTTPLATLTKLTSACQHPLLADEEKPSGLKATDLMKQCLKLRVLVFLARHFKSGGHRTLIFSKSVLYVLQYGYLHKMLYAAICLAFFLQCIHFCSIA